MDLLSLPFDVFCLVLSNLEPSDWAVCIRVSKAWRSGFSENRIVFELLKLHFPRAREVRRLQKQIIEEEDKHNHRYSSKTPEPPPNSTSESSGKPEDRSAPELPNSISESSGKPEDHSAPELPNSTSESSGKPEDRSAPELPKSTSESSGKPEDHSAPELPNSISESSGKPEDHSAPADARTSDIAKEEKFSDIFSKVARRYHHLRSGTPYQIEKFEPAWSRPGWWRYYPVTPWDRHLQLNKSKIPFHYPDPLWAYDDGLLVFPIRALKDYVIFDLEKRSWSCALFPRTPKIVRRLSFRDRVLLLEWAEAAPKEDSQPHAHFATFYDVLPGAEAGRWIIQFRNEIKLNPDGLPLDKNARFFSVHSKTHYAVYLWRHYPLEAPNDDDDDDSNNDEEEEEDDDDDDDGYNEEFLAIYDISTPSTFQLSLTASVESGSMNSHSAAVSPPPIIKILDRDDLALYGILRDGAPQLTALHLDDLNLYVVEEDHFRMAGPQASFTGHPRSHSLQTISIPFGYGPPFLDQCGIGPDDLGMNLCSSITTDRDLKKVPCWRHEEFPSLTVSEAWDEEAGVRFRATRCFLFASLDVFVAPRLVVRMREQSEDLKRRNAICEASLREEWKTTMWEKLGFVEVRMEGMWNELLGSGKIDGDERWIVGNDVKGSVVVCRFN